MRQCTGAGGRVLPALREACASGYSAGRRFHVSASPYRALASATTGFHATSGDARSLFHRQWAAGRSALAGPIASVQVAGHRVALILVAGLAILAGIVYLGYRVGQKATHVAKSISQAATSPSGTLHNPLQDVLAGHMPGDDIPTLSPNTPVTPYPPSPFPDQRVSAHPAEAGHGADQCVGSQVWRCGADQQDRLGG